MSATVTPLAAARAPRRRRPSPRTWIAIGIVAVLALGWLVLASPVLAVKQVSVVGASGRAAQQVADAAQAPVGEPIARVDTGLIASRVLALPWVATAEVRRGYPSSLVIAVTERVPIASLAGQQGFVDAAGLAFTPTGAKPKGLPVIEATGVGLEAAARVIATLPTTLAPRVVRASASTRDDVELTLRSGATVRWGSADQPEFKAQVLEALLGRRAERYDVSAPELPTTSGEKAGS